MTDATQAEKPLPVDPLHPALAPWKILLTFLLFLLVIAALRFSLFQQYKSDIRAEEQNELNAIAQLKIGQITHWMNERRSDAHTIREDPFFTGELERWLKNGAKDPIIRARLLERIESLRRNNGYVSVFILDDKAKIRLSTNGAEISEFDKEFAREAIQIGKVYFSDFHQTDNSQDVELDVAAPIVSNKRTLGMILLRSNPRAFLYPLIQNWPTPSPSAETILVESDGESAIYHKILTRQL
jgi:sensor histidine kinase regulating citrate/malate metabolism